MTVRPRRQDTKRENREKGVSPEAETRAERDAGVPRKSDQDRDGGKEETQNRRCPERKAVMQKPRESWLPRGRERNQPNKLRFNPPRRTMQRTPP